MIARPEASAMIDQFLIDNGMALRPLVVLCALPKILTPEVVAALRLDFARDLPWTAEADLLLSELCIEVGYEQYMYRPEVREELLSMRDEVLSAKVVEKASRALIGHVGRLADRFSSEQLQQQELSFLQFIGDGQRAAQSLVAGIKAALGNSEGGESRKAEIDRLIALAADLRADRGDLANTLDYLRRLGGLAGEQLNRLASSEATTTIAGQSLPVLTGEAAEPSATPGTSEYSHDLLELPERSAIRGIAWAPDGSEIAIAATSGFARWRPGAEPEWFAAESATAITAIGCGEGFVVTGDSRTLNVFKEGRQAFGIVNPVGGAVEDIAVEGDLVVACTRQGVWSCDTHGDTPPEVSHTGGVLAVASLGPRSGYVYGTLTGDLRYASAVYASRHFDLVGQHEGAINSIATEHVGNRVATGSSDGMVGFDGDTLRYLHHGVPVVAVAFSSDGELLASMTLDGVVRVFAVEGWAKIHEVQGETGDFYGALAFQPGSHVLAVAAGGGTRLRLYDVDVMPRIEGPSPPAYGLANYLLSPERERELVRIAEREGLRLHSGSENLGRFSGIVCIGAQHLTLSSRLFADLADYADAGTGPVQIVAFADERVPPDAERFPVLRIGQDTSMHDLARLIQEGLTRNPKASKRRVFVSVYSEHRVATEFFRISKTLEAVDYVAHAGTPDLLETVATCEFALFIVDNREGKLDAMRAEFAAAQELHKPCIAVIFSDTMRSGAEVSQFVNRVERDCIYVAHPQAWGLKDSLAYIEQSLDELLANDGEAAATLSPRRILVAGTGNSRLSERQREAARCLGRQLAVRGHTLIVGGWGGVDEEVTIAFVGALYDAGEFTTDRLMILTDRKRASAARRRAKFVDLEPYESLGYDRSLDLADGLIAVGGLRGTQEIFNAFRKRQKPVIGVCGTGGVAEEIRGKLFRASTSTFDAFLESKGALVEMERRLQDVPAHQPPRKFAILLHQLVGTEQPAQVAALLEGLGYSIHLLDWDAAEESILALAQQIEFESNNPQSRVFIYAGDRVERGGTDSGSLLHQLLLTHKGPASVGIVLGKEADGRQLPPGLSWVVHSGADQYFTSLRKVLAAEPTTLPEKPLLLHETSQHRTWSAPHTFVLATPGELGQLHGKSASHSGVHESILWVTERAATYEYAIGYAQGMGPSVRVMPTVAEGLRSLELSQPGLIVTDSEDFLSRHQASWVTQIAFYSATTRRGRLPKAEGRLDLSTNSLPEFLEYLRWPRSRRHSNIAR